MNYKYENLRMVKPDFDSKITDYIIKLNHLREKSLDGTTHPEIFFQLKKIFQMLESIGSARIEGNHTTIAEYIDFKANKTKSEDKEIREIVNMENALEFVDENIDKQKINKKFICKLHKIVLRGLFANDVEEIPGQYRTQDVGIFNSSHSPPNFQKVPDYMDELFTFINKKFDKKYDLLKTAITHHRFTWIHPFKDGNGRLARLLTYAMLIKQGFNISNGIRILNPTAVFCFDRNKYYKFLERADSGKKEDILSWCEYVLKGLKNEIEKIDRLLDYDYVKNNILIPAINFSKKREIIIGKEEKILKIAVKKQTFKNADIAEIFEDKKKSQISREIRKLKKKKLIKNKKNKSRIYIINFEDNLLMRGIIKALIDNNFVPKNEKVE